MNIAAPSRAKEILAAIPKRPVGPPRKGFEEIYQNNLRRWANEILILDSKSDFKISSRGWCYILEQYGLGKGDFDLAEAKINECRKAGFLPLDICAEDVRRRAKGLENLDDDDHEDFAASLFRGTESAHEHYTPFSFWDDKEIYIEMVVEKIDLVNLFMPVCRKFRIPIKNNVGWNDINSRVHTMKRMAEHSAEGRECVLLYAGDFDPAGLVISAALRDNMKELEGAVNFELAQDGIPDLNIDDVVIDRFGLNYDFINDTGLSWIDGLETGSGKRLDDIGHKDHDKDYVQGYLRNYCPDWGPPPDARRAGTGARKCEANALVTQPKAARKLCLRTILKYLSPRDPARYRTALKEPREELRREIMRYGYSRATHDQAGRYLIRPPQRNSNRGSNYRGPATLAEAPP
jgi:hypothetical protein